MPLIIADEILEQAGLTEREALIEFACRLYDAGKLSQPRAAKLAGLSRVEFEDALIARNLPLIRIDEEYWQQELESLRRMEQEEHGQS